jgi:hypothetical protein
LLSTASQLVGVVLRHFHLHRVYWKNGDFERISVQAGTVLKLFKEKREQRYLNVEEK